MPPCPMAIPSSTPMVLNSKGTPPAFRISSFAIRAVLLQVEVAGDDVDVAVGDADEGLLEVLVLDAHRAEEAAVRRTLEALLDPVAAHVGCCRGKAGRSQSDRRRPRRPERSLHRPLPPGRPRRRPVILLRCRRPSSTTPSCASAPRWRCARRAASTSPASAPPRCSCRSSTAPAAPRCSSPAARSASCITAARSPSRAGGWRRARARSRRRCARPTRRLASTPPRPRCWGASTISRAWPGTW